MLQISCDGIADILKSERALICVNPAALLAKVKLLTQAGSRAENRTLTSELLAPCSVLIWL